MHHSRLALPGAVVALAVGLLQAQPAAPAAAPNAACNGCHEQGTKLKASAHATVACISCHVRHDVVPHPPKIPKPQCSQCHAEIAARFEQSVHGEETRKGNAAAPNCAGCHDDVHEVKDVHTADFKKAIPENCGLCHADPLADYQGGIHGQLQARGDRQVPVCTDCHTSHSVMRPKNPNSSVFSAAIPDTCGKCHGGLVLRQRLGQAANPVSSFDESFHGLALKSGSKTVANCASCHGYHRILPSGDPKSSIHPTNIAKTCGQCHPGAGAKFQIGKVHEIEGGEPLPIRYARLFYLLVIPGTIGLMLLHHAGDFIRKLAYLRFRKQALELSVRPTSNEIRMTGMERFQHGLLVISFFTLVWTGFALHYPDEWWSRPLLHWEKAWPVRGTLHRGAAVVMIFVSLFHVWTLGFRRELRERWKTFLPVVGDVREFFEGLMWRLGMMKAKPHRSPHSYIEKAEYWAVVWGTFVMALTGVLLWANRWTLEWLPKVWLDFSRTIHFYEAVLATLAIFVWHFYMVIFDPEVYPMDPAWWSGKSPRHHSHYHHQGDGKS